MSLFQLLLIAFGLTAVVGLIAVAFSGPSASKESARRLQALRERHSENTLDKVEAQLRKAVAARSALIQEFDEAFKTVDVIATPTMPTPAFKIGEKSDPLSLYLEDVFTVTANLTGMPAISVPMGTVEREGKQLPVGIQFTAPRGADARVFTIGANITGEQL